LAILIATLTFLINNMAFTKEDLNKALVKSQNDPIFKFELQKRINSGVYNSILESQGIDTSQFHPKKEKGAIRKFGEALIQSETRFGKSIAGAVGSGVPLPFTDKKLFGGINKQFKQAQSKQEQTITGLLKAIRDKKAKGEDTTKLKTILDSMNFNVTNSLQQEFEELTPRQVVGQAVGVGVDILGAGAVATKGTGLVTKPTSFLKGAGQGAFEGLKTGATFGGGQGFARGLQDDKEGIDLAVDTAVGGVVGGVFGSVLGGITGGVSGGLRGKALRKAQLTKELAENPELVAKFDLGPKGTPIKDKAAIEAVKQGIPENHVAVVKNAAEVDKSKFRTMFGLAEKSRKDARFIERPSDVVGETIIERTSHLARQKKITGVGVDDAAKALKGQRVDPTDAVQAYIDDLSEMGVTFRKGKPVFDGSDIEGITPAERLISKITKRADSVTDDGLQLHQLKKFIDEQVTFAKQGEGLSGQTERVVKGFRHAIDEALDGAIPAYDEANIAYSAVRNLTDDTQTILGKNFNPTTGKIKAGSVARRILGNSASRGDILDYLNALEKYFKATGGTGSDDIISQVVFADILEDTFGTQATTGLQGQVQRGIDKLGGVAQDLGQGQTTTGLVRLGIEASKKIQGITDEAKIQALKTLIGSI